MSENPIDRRVHERFRMNPGYTSLGVRVHPEERYTHEGHIYDLSEGGICFEVDYPIDPGQTVSMRIDLPNAIGPDSTDSGPGRAVFATGNVIWCDLEEPGPARMAVAVTRYDREGDRERLIRALSSGRYQRAA